MKLIDKHVSIFYLIGSITTVLVLVFCLVFKIPIFVNDYIGILNFLGSTYLIAVLVDKTGWFKME